MVYGKRKACMGKNIWALNALHLLLMKMVKLQNIFPKVKIEGHVEEVLKALKG